jgi:cell volume regulation protein A
MSENVPHAKFMFNIVFFITILSLILQGTSINRIAQKFKLDVPLKDAEFNVTLPDEITAVTSEIEVSAELISDGALIRDITLPPKTLVVMVKRGERYLVPTGNTRLCLGDSLFIISEDHKDMEDLMARHG